MMKTIPFLLLFITVAVLGVATFVEDARDTAFIQAHVYGSRWFALLWAVNLACLLYVAIRRKMWKRLPSFILHAGFAVIFTGALLTAFTGRKGILHLREGIPATSYMDKDKRPVPLPFIMTLDSFRVEYYAGTDTPADYVSQVRCQASDGTPLSNPRISMNRIFSADGYRFYQSSFDEDMRGSWLMVNHDPCGTPVTYAGFLLLVVGFLLACSAPRGGFRRLLRHPLLRRGLFALLCLFSSTAKADDALPVIKRSQADSLASVQVIYNGRISPLDTPARDFVQKVYGRPTFHGLTPEQVVASWQLYPEAWNHVPFIRIKNRELRRRLHIETEHAALSQLFEGKSYRLQPLWQQTESTRSPMAKAIQETDEKVGLVLMLIRGTLATPLPAGTPRLSPGKIRAELCYNRIPFCKILFMANLTLGIAAFALLIWRMLKGRRESPTSRKAWTAALWTATLFHTAGYALRGYITGGIPLAGGYETMLFVAWVSLLAACLLYPRFPFVLPFGFLLSGFTLLVAHLSEMNPQVTPLMPVLASPWLSWHVSLIMISYALFAFICLNGLLALALAGCPWKPCRPSNRERVMQLTLLSRLLLYPATFLLGTGILLGSIWANVSWGSYWSWDPKEVWAFIAFIVYGLAFHPHALPWLKRPRLFHAYMVGAFAVVLMTYFGVNYLLGGMHSYANV